MTIFESFKRNRDERADHAAFLIASGDRSVPITWREFAHDIEAIAWIIRKYVPGATIALLGTNSYEWMTAHAACLFAGATVLPLEAGLQPEDIAERLSFTGTRVLLHSAALADRARAVKKLLPKLIIGAFGDRVTDRVLALARKALADGEPGVFDLPPRDEDETSMLVFTSGTTSKPRGAELCLHGLRVFSDYWSSLLHFTPEQRTLMLLPLNHIFGIATTYMMLCHGVAVGVCPDFRRIYEAVERFRADFLFLVPALAEMLATKIAQKGRTVEEVGLSLRWLLVGGAPLPGRAYQQLKSLGIQPVTGYGLTETTALYCAAELEDPHPGSAGRSCHGFEGMETRVSPEGILQIRGPAVLKGYYKEPERTAAVLDKDGWFSTGDYGRIDADGYVWITGRASRTIILSSGKKVAPEELEEKLLSVPGFQEVVVSGDFETREILAEIYASVPEQTVREQVAQLNQKLPLYQRIRKVVVRTEPFPRTASGKIQVGNPRKTAPVVPVAPATEVVPSAPLREMLAYWAKVVLPLMTAAVVVAGLSIAKFILKRCGMTIPPSLVTLEEIGEFVLAVLVILVVVGLQNRRKLFQLARDQWKALREKKG